MNPFDEKALEIFKNMIEKERDKGPVPTNVHIGITAGLAAAPPLYKLITRQPLRPSIIPEMALMGTAGYLIPLIINKALANRPIDKDVRNIVAAPMEKKAAGFFSTLGGATLKAGRYAARGVRDFAKGVVSPISKPGMTTGQKALSIGSKALVGYGLYRGAKAAYNYGRRPDYSTYLRNQVAAGNIQPSELDPADIESIRKLSSLRKEARIPLGPALGTAFTIMAGRDAVMGLKAKPFKPALSLPQSKAPWMP